MPFERGGRQSKSKKRGGRKDREGKREVGEIICVRAGERLTNLGGGRKIEYIEGGKKQGELKANWKKVP